MINTKIPYCLYNKDKQLIEDPFILPVMVWNKKFITNGITELWCLGPVKEGDLICSSYIKGIAMATNFPAVSFGVAINSFPNKLEIGKILVKFIESNNL